MLTIVSNSDSFNSVFPEKRKSINLAKTRKADDVAVRANESSTIYCKVLNNWVLELNDEADFWLFENSGPWSCTIIRVLCTHYFRLQSSLFNHSLRRALLRHFRSLYNTNFLFFILSLSFQICTHTLWLPNGKQSEGFLRVHSFFRTKKPYYFFLDVELNSRTCFNMCTRSSTVSISLL